MTQSRQLPLASSGPFALIALLFAAMLIGLFFTTTIAAAVSSPGTKEFLWATASLQNVLAFAVPTLLIAYLSRPRPLGYIGIDRPVSPLSLILMVAVFAISLPAMNQIIYWNEHLTLPESMSDIEASFRAMEDAARSATDLLLKADSTGDLILNVLVMGCLTGLCEELFFRAGIQKLLSRSMSAHAAVWVGALVFSLMHFQFFGFVPRLLLGAFFGYLYVWSGSIWLNATAHAVNNSLVVVTAWIEQRSGSEIDSEMWGVTADGFPWLALLSGVAVVVAMVWLHRKKAFGNG